MLMVYTRVDFKWLVKKIYYCLKINWRQSNVYIYTDNDLTMLENPFELQDDDDIEFFMIVAREKVLPTCFYVTKSQFKERDNLDEEQAEEEQLKNDPTFDWAQPQSIPEDKELDNLNDDDDDDNNGITLSAWVWSCFHTLPCLQNVQNMLLWTFVFKSYLA